MIEILDFAWSELNPDSEEIMGNINLTSSLPDSMLPYHDQNGELLMLKSTNKMTLNLVLQTQKASLDLLAHLTITKLTGDTAIKCHLCGNETKLKDMQTHVGKHIILTLQGIDENVYLLPGTKV